jgi:hypothetical protein
MNLLYLARRAVAALQQKDEGTKFAELEQMKMANPQLYALVIRMLQKEQGSQADPLNPVQSPLPQQKPERRASHVGV